MIPFVGTSECVRIFFKLIFELKYFQLKRNLLRLNSHFANGVAFRTFFYCWCNVLLFLLFLFISVLIYDVEDLYFSFHVTVALISCSYFMGCDYFYINVVKNPRLKNLLGLGCLHILCPSTNACKVKTLYLGTGTGPEC